ncbi:MAG: DNA photolyase family protein [Hyphomonadaceae bacterium]|nr:DNA photolyase family protein [Hyphomonadaceae bacterium]
MPDAPAIVWFRQDLRLADNPALDAACKSQRPLILLYVLDDETPGRWRTGAASRWWLHRSIEALAETIAKRGASLTLRRGRADQQIPLLVEQTGAGAVYWNRQYEPYAVDRDRLLKPILRAKGVVVESFNAALLHEPVTLRTKSGEPYRVFSPFWRAILARGVARAPLPTPKALRQWGGVEGNALRDWNLLPASPNWAAEFESEWAPGEAGASAALQRFLSEKLAGYFEGRDQLGQRATSRLSPHLHFGEVSPVQIWRAVNEAGGGDKFLSEIGWREFSSHLLLHFPTLPEKNLRPAFDAFPWRHDPGALAAWQRGVTGYPVVDAAMRELWATGYMHNRARMIAASFLLKHLLIDWRHGQDWFWDTLVDADLANNSASWQWVAGSGADAAPYFRIFNPVTQGQRYDADGAYVRRWLPELAALPNALIHAPWEASAAQLATAGVELGRDYPHRIVEHAEARARALAAFKGLSSMRKSEP